MIKTGLHIQTQQVVKRETYYETFGYLLYWVQEKTTFLGIPLYVKNIKVFPRIDDAIKFVQESAKGEPNA